MFRGLSRSSRRQAFPHMNAGLLLPRAGLLLYLGRPNLEAADISLGDDTEIGDDTIIRWMFLLPADADIRAATGWVSGVGNIFYDVAGDPVAALASEITAWSSINQWNVLFHLVSADTESGKLAIYAVDTPAEILDRAMKVLRAPQPDLPSVFFNGEDFRLATYTGGPTYVPDHLGVLRSPGANLPAVQGMRLATTIADGAVLGPELVVNGGFDTGLTGWTADVTGSNTITAESGGARLVFTGADTATLRKSPDVTIQAGPHLFEIDIAAGSTGSFKILPFGTLSETVINAEAYAGTKFIATLIVPSSAVFLIRRVVGAVCNVRIDNLSIKAIVPIYYNTDGSGNQIIASTPQKTVTYNTDWTAKTFAETFDKFDISDPLKAPGWLCEPVRTNYALNSATPATHTTGTIAVGTYTLWQEGTGSIVATAGTAVGTFGTASNGTPVTITITIAGTVVLTASGTNTWVQLELGAFKTSRIYTTTAPMVRAAAVAASPTAGKIPVNNFAIRMIVVPRATGQSGARLFSSYSSSTAYIAIILGSTSLVLAKNIEGVYAESVKTITHNNGVPIDIIVVSTLAGIQIAVRTFSAVWSVFTDGTLSSNETAKANAPIAPTYQLGASNSTNQFTGNISLFDCVPIPSGITDPMAWAKTHWCVA